MRNADEERHTVSTPSLPRLTPALAWQRRTILSQQSSTLCALAVIRFEDETSHERAHGRA